MRRQGRSRFSRRQMLGASLAMGFSGLHVTFAQSIPGASPTADDAYALPEMLADVDWLETHVDDPDMVVVALTPREEFERGHIPGSRQIDWPALEATDTTDDSLAAWRGDVERTITELNITPAMTVVAYDEGTLFAARLWWVLHYLGHDDVRVLNGGLPAWQAAGNEVEIGSGGTDFPATEPYVGDPRPDVIAQVDEVVDSLDDPDVAIVDARTADEYAEGHVPGAVNVNFPLNALPEAPRFWKPAGELRAMYEEAGVTPDKHVIPYCSTGVRSAVTYFTLRLIGYARVSLFTGSWAEWTSYPDLPVTTGDQP
ncbi:MAG: sulfurtransferase [Thermomicrobiales bacterium]